MKINEKLEFPLSQIGIFALILSVMFTAGCGGSKTTFSLSEIGIAEGKGRICMYRPSSLVAMTASANVKLVLVKPKMVNFSTLIKNQVNIQYRLMPCF